MPNRFPEGLIRLEVYEAGGDALFYGAPGVPRFFGPDGQPLDFDQIEPRIPYTYDFTANRMVPGSDRPVVCASSLARLATLRALCHPANHPELHPRYRRHGWRIEGRDMPTPVATRALMRLIHEKAGDLRASVYRLHKAAPLKVWPPQAPYQYRSTDPVKPVGVEEVHGDRDFPTDVEIVEPYPHVPCLGAFRSERTPGCLCDSCLMVDGCSSTYLRAEDPTSCWWDIGVRRAGIKAASVL